MILRFTAAMLAILCFRTRHIGGFEVLDCHTGGLMLSRPP